MTSPGNQKDLYDWLRENPHKFHLGRIGFLADRVKPIRQELDLWTGILTSEFEAEGKRIHVETACHPRSSLLAVRIRGRLPVVFEFPYASPEMSGADWNQSDRHTTVEQDGTIERRLDNTKYTVGIRHNGTLRRDGPHRFVLDAGEFTFGDDRTSTVQSTFDAVRDHWRKFW